MTEPGIHKAVTVWGLSVVGAFHPQSGDSVPEGVETIYLLGACNDTGYHLEIDLANREALAPAFC